MRGSDCFWKIASKTPAGELRHWLYNQWESSKINGCVLCLFTCLWRCFLTGCRCSSINVGLNNWTQGRIKFVNYCVTKWNRTSVRKTWFTCIGLIGTLLKLYSCRRNLENGRKLTFSIFWFVYIQCTNLL